ncbi:MAG: 30S ribosomal protein S20 [Candidatus Latescibacterota bacterium]|nr:30S ribosomal protein S20 [Candidatus Latescibacterota bacterium]
MQKLRSSKKRLRQAKKASERNKPVRTRFRSTLKRVRSAESKEAAENMLVEAFSTIDRTARKGVIHTRAAARYKSRLAKQVATML